MAESKSCSALLKSWLDERLTSEQLDWLASRLTSESIRTDRAFYLTLGQIPRKMGRADLMLTPDEQQNAHEIRSGLDASQWSVDVAARVLVLLARAESDPADFGDLFVSLCGTADLSESIALYAGTPLYPKSDALDRQISEGLRTNISAIFEAVAHRNPYPKEVFDEHRWNQMVLKALFIGSSLHPIQGLDERANEELAVILCNYADERWAAGRSVHPELWRCVAPFATEERLQHLINACERGSDIERDGAILALSLVDKRDSGQVLAGSDARRTHVQNNALSWASIHEQLHLLA